MTTMPALARTIANAALVVEFSEASQVDPDLAVQALEQMAHDLQRLSTDEQRALSGAFIGLSLEYTQPPHAEFVANLGGSLGLAADPQDSIARE